MVSEYYQGKRVIVASLSAVGRACVQWFAEAGATVAVLDPDASEFCHLTGGQSGEVVPLEVNLDDWDAIRQIGARWAEERGSLDVLVNAQMALDLGGVEDGSVESMEYVVSVNLIGPFVCTQAFLPSLKRAVDSAVVNVGSIDGTYGIPKLTSYSASKGGVIPLTHTMSHELGPYGIRVNCVAIGGVGSNPTSTPDTAAPSAGAVDRSKLLEATPLGRLAQPEEFAKVVGSLASPDAGYMTGSVVTVDGGKTAVTRGSA